MYHHWRTQASWHFGTILCAAAKHRGCGECCNENTVTTLADGRSVLAVWRMGAGDGHKWNHTMSSIDGYQFYNHALSTDGGVSFTTEAPLHGMGSARPKLLSLGNLIMLGGGRNRAENTNDILLWSSSSSSFSSRGGWREHSISYWHNRLAATAGVSKFTEEVNSTSEPVCHARARYR